MNIRFRNALTRGIRSDSRQSVGAQALLNCFGRRCMEHGLRDSLPLVDPSPDHTGFDYGSYPGNAWPFPQAFYGKAVSLVCEETQIWKRVSTAWVLQSLYDARDFGESSPASATIAAGGGPWQFLDMYDSWMLFNGTHVVFKTAIDSHIFVACTDNNAEVTRAFNTGAPNNWTPVLTMTGWTVDGTMFKHDNSAGATEVQVGSTLAAAKLNTSLSATRRYKVTLNKGASTNPVIVKVGSYSLGPSLSFAGTGTSTQYVYTADVAPSAMSVSVTCLVAAHETVVLNSLSVTLESAPIIQTGCVHKESRAILGGFSNAYNYADWYTLLAVDTNIVASSTNPLRTVLGTQPPGINWVWWSSLSAPDLLWLYSLRLMKYFSLRAIEGNQSTGFTDAVLTDNTSRRRWFIDSLVEQRSFGMRPMPWNGHVRRVMAFDDPVVVYGQADTSLLLRGGVSALVPAMAAGDPTFGVQHLLNTGICGRNAVGGDNQVQLFVDENMEAWTIEPNLKATNLGYQDTLEALTPGTIAVSFNARDREFHISGEDDGTPRSFLLTKAGMSEVGRTPTSISMNGADLVAPYYPIEADVDDSVTVETDVFGLPEGDVLPELDYVRLIGPAQDWSQWSIRVYYSFDGTMELHPDTWTPDQRGVARVKVTGTLFRIKATQNTQNCPLDDIEAGFGNGDNRMLSYLIA